MSASQTPSRWLHAWAVLTVGLVFVQLLLGSLVTTLHAGMADPTWPTVPWYLLQINWGEASYNLGYLVEHTHRASGSIVGIAVIVLAVWLWLREQRSVELRCLGVVGLVPMVALLAAGFVVAEPWIWLACLATCAATVLVFLVVALVDRERGLWLPWLGTTALAGVIVQGLFGGFRVFWHAEIGPELAIVHGCLAQVYFAAIAWLAALTRPSVDGSSAPTSLRWWSLVVLALVLGQVLMGVLLRHTMHPVWQRLHLMWAFVAVLAVLGLISRLWAHPAVVPGSRRWAIVLGVLLGAQVLFGVEAWMGRFSAGKPPEMVVIASVGQVGLRTGHVLGGALLLASTAVIAVRVCRPRLSELPPALGEDEETVTNEASELEGVA
jgi:heme A synthase